MVPDLRHPSAPTTVHVSADGSGRFSLRPVAFQRVVYVGENLFTRLARTPGNPAITG